MGTPLRLFHPRTFLETWENVLGWLLPKLAPLEHGLHSILASGPVCLLICMTVPLSRIPGLGGHTPPGTLDTCS